MEKQYLVCLSIAGSDPSGGAGMQADIKTFSALGCYGAGVVTALTVQNTCGVSRSVPVPADLVYEQTVAVLSDLQPVAIKIGMTGNAATTEAVASALTAAGTKQTFVVLDPVLCSSSGHTLLDAEAADVLRRRLMPLCHLVTPNLPEVRELTGIEEPRAAAEALMRQTGCPAVLVKGGHRDGAPTDWLFTAAGSEAFEGERVATRNTHGTGCALSSAIAAWSARGVPLSEAVARAKKYVGNALKSGADVNIGNGHGPMNHFFHPVASIIKEK